MDSFPPNSSALLIENLHIPHCLSQQITTLSFKLGCITFQYGLYEILIYWNWNVTPPIHDCNSSRDDVFEDQPEELCSRHTLEIILQSVGNRNMTTEMYQHLKVSHKSTKESGLRERGIIEIRSRINFVRPSDQTVHLTGLKAKLEILTAHTKCLPRFVIYWRETLGAGRVRFRYGPVINVCGQWLANLKNLSSCHLTASSLSREGIETSIMYCV
jgi:hypothetical protein